MENLGIDIKFLIAQLINFFLFFYIFKKFISKPFNHFLTEEKRKEEIKEKLDQMIKQAEEKRVSDEKNFRLRMEKEREKIIREARDQAEKLRHQMLEEANDEIDRLKKKANEELLRNKQLMEKSLKKEIVSLSLDIVKISLKNYLTPETSKEITRLILKNSVKEN